MKYIRLFIAFMLMACSVSAQYSSRNNEAKLDADYYVMMQEYDRALKLYLNILESEPENASIKYKIGICYLNSENEKETAIPYLEEASQKVSEKYNPNSFKEMNAPVDALFLLGSAYRVNSQLDKAIDAYTRYKSFLSPGDEYNNKLIDRYISNCRTASVMQKNPVNIEATNLGSAVNNENSNFNPVISGDGKSLAYTSPASRQGYDIYFATQENGIWSSPKNITSQLGGSNKFFKTACLSYDGTTLYLVAEDPFDSDIYFSTYSRNRWSRPEEMDKPVNSTSMETHASISADGTTLFFTSNRKGGEGDLDIYKSTLDNKGKWSKPVNLGPSVNTLFNEDTPFISADGNTLFFSSEGHDGMGGFDIYKIDLTDPAAKPVNLGYPINTTDNDYFFLPVEEGNTGYYAMMNRDSYGSYDIYRIDILSPPVSYIMVRGIIQTDVNIDTLSPELFQIQIQNASSGEIVEQPVRRDLHGQFNCELPAGDYNISITAENFTSYSKFLKIPESYTEPEMFVEAFLSYQIPEAEMAAVPRADTSAIPVDDLLSDTKTVAEPVVETTAGITETKKDETTATEPVVHETTEIIPEALPERPSSAYTEITRSETIHDFEAKAYTVQLMALKEPVDLTYFKDITDVSVTYSADKWYRYTLGITTDPIQAEMLKNKLAEKGYKDAFVLKKAFAPSYTIQVMAVPGPVVDMENFSNLTVITVARGTDIFTRYTTGEYETLAEAKSALNMIRQLGYADAFIRKL